MPEPPKPRVSLARCPGYEPEDVLAAVRHAVDLLGGMRTFVRPGQHAFLKVNLLRPSRPEEAVVTHPSVVRAVALLVREAGGRAVIGDSPGGPSSLAFVRRAYRLAGLYEVARETGAELNEDISSVRVPCRGGRLVRELDVLRAVEEADVVIPISKLKTHPLTGLTGAVKVLFGVVPGLSKAAFHLKLPEPERFSRMLLDVAAHVGAPLHVMDAVVAMDGEGPSTGSPFPLGAVLAGTDPVALDLAACRLAGLDPALVATLAAAAELGVGPASLSEVELLGDPIGSPRAEGFRPARSGQGRVGSVPAPLRRLALRIAVPFPRAGPRCTGCGACAEVCPAKAVEVRGGRARVDLGRCIRCYCCHETCPHRAMELRERLLARLLPW